MFQQRFLFEPCRNCTDYWTRQGGGSAPPCIRVNNLGSQGLLAVKMGTVGGGGFTCCPCIISWPEVYTYATGGAGAARMSTEAQSLIKIVREYIRNDPKCKDNPTRACFLEGKNRNNYHGYLVVDKPPNLAGQWHFLRRLSDDEYTQLLQFRLTYAMDVDWNDWVMKLEAAIWQAGPKVAAKAGGQIAAMFAWENLAILVGSIAVMFGPQGVAVGIARAILGIVGFGTLALQIAEMFADFGAKVMYARSPRDLDRAADVLADIMVACSITVAMLFLTAGVAKWKAASSEAKMKAPQGGESAPAAEGPAAEQGSGPAAPVGRATGKGNLRVLDGAMAADMPTPMAVARGVAKSILPKLIDQTSRTVRCRNLAELDRTFTGEGFRMIKAEPYGPDGGYQIFWQKGNVLARFKTMGEKGGPRANKPHLSLGYNDAKALDWQNDMGKFDSKGDVVAKVITDPAKFNPVDFQGNPQRFVLIPTNFDIADVDAWAARTHFNANPGFGLDGLSSIVSRVP